MRFVIIVECDEGAHIHNIAYGAESQLAAQALANMLRQLSASELNQGSPIRGGGYPHIRNVSGPAALSEEP